MSEHIHDEHCTCGCHDHAHHEHHHDEHCGCHDHVHHENHHDHDEHCTCGCHDHDHDHHHHSHGEEVVEQSLVLSREGQLAMEAGSLEAAVERTAEGLLGIADAISIEGIVPGHIKALLSSGDTRCTLSVTRAGACDILWPEDRGCVAHWDLTVNIISAIKPACDVEGLLAALFA